MVRDKEAPPLLSMDSGTTSPGRQIRPENREICQRRVDAAHEVTKKYAVDMLQALIAPALLGLAPVSNRSVDRYRDEPQVIRAQQTERPRGTFVAHKSEKCCPTKSTNVNQPRTKWPIEHVPCGLVSLF